MSLYCTCQKSEGGVFERNLGMPKSSPFVSFLSLTNPLRKLEMKVFVDEI